VAKIERDLGFHKVATREIEAAFDRVRPDGSWRPFKDEDGRMHGIQWGWVLANGHLSYTVTGAKNKAEQHQFERALFQAVNDAVRKATYAEAKRRQRET